MGVLCCVCGSGGRGGGGADTGDGVVWQCRCGGAVEAFKGFPAQRPLLRSLLHGGEGGAIAGRGLFQLFMRVCVCRLVWLGQSGVHCPQRGWGLFVEACFGSNHSLFRAYRSCYTLTLDRGVACQFSNDQHRKAFNSLKRGSEMDQNGGSLERGSSSLKKAQITHTRYSEPPFGFTPHTNPNLNPP